MQKLSISLFLILWAFSVVSCVTSKSIENEKRMEEWLSTATIPVTVSKCRPSLQTQPELLHPD